MPRVAGLDHALELIVLGEPIGAAKAFEFGIFDEIVEGDLLDGAIAFAERVLDENRNRRITSEPREGIGSPDQFAEVIQKYRDLANRRMRGQGSPHEAIGSVIDGLEMPYEKAVAAYQEGYRYAPHLHVFTFNIASAAEAGGDCRTALTYYQMFVDLVAEHPKRRTAKKKVTALEQECRFDEESEEMVTSSSSGLML